MVEKMRLALVKVSQFPAVERVADRLSELDELALALVATLTAKIFSFHSDSVFEGQLNKSPTSLAKHLLC